jgi:hypothetical protein
MVARPAVSIPGEILRHLSILAAQLDILVQAATSEAMTESIPGIVETTMKIVDTHPDHVHEPSQNFRPVTDKTHTQDMLRAADELILEKIRGLRSSPVTIQMDAGIILHHHFLNYVVSHAGLRPFLFHTEFHNTFAQVDYSTITTVIEQLLEKGVVVGGLSRLTWLPTIRITINDRIRDGSSN